MPVKLLHFAVYCDDDRWVMDPYLPNAVIQHPTWADIEEAIRRLDTDCYPYVWLFRAEHAEEDDLADFDVIGGEGVYAFECRLNGIEYSYFDPTHSDEEVPVWRSDQGWQCPEKYVCYDVDTVLKAARYYCEHGVPDPDLIWQERLIP